MICERVEGINTHVGRGLLLVNVPKLKYTLHYVSYRFFQFL